MPRGKKKKTDVPTGVKVPDAVKKAEEAAQQAQAKLVDPDNEPDPNDVDDGTDPEPAEPTPAEPAPVEPAEPQRVVNPDGVDPDLFKDPEPVTPAEPAPSDYEQKYKTLEGKYKVDLERRDKIIATQETMLKQLEERLSALEQTPQTPQTPVAQDVQLIDPEEYEGYGPEMKKMANLVISLQGQLKDAIGHINALQSQGVPNKTVDHLTQDIEYIKAQNAHSLKTAYEEYLDKNVADRYGNPVWRKIAGDPRFHQWLEQPEPMTGIPRKQILKKHNGDMNGRQVTYIYHQFIQSLSATPQQRQSNTHLESQVIPESAGGQTQTHKKESDTATLEEFEAAKQAVIQGKMKPEEFDKIAAKFQKSIAKGRVIGVPTIPESQSALR
jgi:hypothetical protein